MFCSTPQMRCISTRNNAHWSRSSRARTGEEKKRAPAGLENARPWATAFAHALAYTQVNTHSHECALDVVKRRIVLIANSKTIQMRLFPKEARYRMMRAAHRWPIASRALPQRLSQKNGGHRTRSRARCRPGQNRSLVGTRKLIKRLLHSSFDHGCPSTVGIVWRKSLQ